MKIASLAGPLELGGDSWRWVQAAKANQAAPAFFKPGFPPNVGDWFVTQIVDRLLDYDELVLMSPTATQAQWDQVNEECDVLVLKGGNYLQSRYLADHIGIDVLRQVRIPIVIFGAGIQDVGAGLEFDPEERAILELIHGQCAFSAVRGERSADALASIGIHNVVVTGCPTLFWSRQPQLTIRPPSDHLAGFSFRTSLYTDADTSYRAQFDAIEAVRDRFTDTRVILQGEEVELQLLHQATRWGAEMSTTAAGDEVGVLRVRRSRLDAEALRRQVHARFDPVADPAFVDWVTRSTFFSWDTGEYLDLYRSCGLVVGCRLHSNLLSLANGTPAYYLTYDDRTREIVDLIGVPSSPLTEFGPHVDPMAADWATVEKRYSELYRELRRFLEGNDLAHRLDEAALSGR